MGIKDGGKQTETERCGSDRQKEIVLETKCCHLYDNPGLKGKLLLTFFFLLQSNTDSIVFHFTSDNLNIQAELCWE